MIYTVTLNPSVDLYVEMDQLNPLEINRMRMDQKIPGGKAINAARVLHELGIPSVATGFLGGFTGDFISEWLTHEGVRHEFHPIQNDSRVNIKLLMPEGETSINAIGPEISKEELQDFILYMSRVQEGDFVLMGGSYSPSLGHDIYDRLIAICVANKANFVADIPPRALKTALEHRPLLIKPNQEDLAKMFETTFDGYEDLLLYGLDCIQLGAQNAIVSLGAEGALLFTRDQSIYRSYGVPGEFVNSVASRDAMIAGFVGMYMRSSDPVESFRVASAAALATAYTYDLPTGDEIRDMAKKVKIDQIRQGHKV